MSSAPTSAEPPRRRTGRSARRSSDSSISILAFALSASHLPTQRRPSARAARNRAPRRPSACGRVARAGRPPGSASGPTRDALRRRAAARGRLCGDRPPATAPARRRACRRGGSTRRARRQSTSCSPTSCARGHHRSRRKPRPRVGRHRRPRRDDLDGRPVDERCRRANRARRLARVDTCPRSRTSTPSVDRPVLQSSDAPAGLRFSGVPRLH